MRLILLSLIIFILINYFIYIIILISIKDKNAKFRIIYLKILMLIVYISIVVIPILNSSFLYFIFPENISYFTQFWIWFLPLGIILIIVGIKINTMTKKNSKNKLYKWLEFNLLDEGIYKIMRHPRYSAFILMYFGLILILDSFIGLILCPILYILLEIKIFVEEKLILSPKFGEKFEVYKNKTPFRLFPNPYNYVLIIVSILIIYIGFLSFLP